MPIMTMGKTQQLTDRVIALDMLGKAAAGAESLYWASVMAHNPDLKRLYTGFLQQGMAAIGGLQTYVTDQGWAKPFASPDDQLKMALENADSMIAVKA